MGTIYINRLLLHSSGQYLVAMITFGIILTICLILLVVIIVVFLLKQSSLNNSKTEQVVAMVMSKLQVQEKGPQQDVAEVQIEIEHENPGNSLGIRIPNVLPQPPEQPIERAVQSIYDNADLYRM